MAKKNCEENANAEDQESNWNDIQAILGKDPDFPPFNLTPDPPLAIDTDYKRSIPPVEQNLPNNIFQPDTNCSAIQNNSSSTSSQLAHIQQRADSSHNNPHFQELESASIVHLSDEPRGIGFAKTSDEYLMTGNATMGASQFHNAFNTEKSVQATTNTITTLEPMQTSPSSNKVIEDEGLESPSSPSLEDSMSPLATPTLQLHSLMQPSTSQAVAITSESYALPNNFPMTSLQQKPIVMYSLPQQTVQGSIPTFIMQQPATLPGSGGVVPAGGSSSGGGCGAEAMLDIPNLTDMKGEYDFNVKIEEKERTMKSPMWLMSTVTNKLYTNINKAVPFEIYLGKMPADTSQLYVKAVPVFTTPQYLRTNVTRCRNHAALTDSTNHDFPYPEYVVRADHPNARYCKCSSGRLGVEVSLDQLKSGKEFTPILLRFMCLGSCVGGISRRPIAVLITLENLHGEVLGRKVIDVRVCACPTRDIKSDEQAAMGTKRKGSSGSQEKAPVVRKKPKIEPRLEVEDDHIYTIRVRGPELYTLLKNLKDGYLAMHSDYTTRYPDPPQLSCESPQRSPVQKNMMTEASRLEKTEEMTNGNWDMESEAPRYELIDNSPRDPLEITEDSDSLPNSHIPHMQLYMLNNTMETENARGISETLTKSQRDLVTPSMAKASPSKSPLKKQPTVCVSKHVPVVQVSSYKSIRRNASEPPKLSKIRQPQNLSDPTFLTHRPPQTLARTMSVGQVQGGLGMRIPNIKLERDLSTTPEGSVSPSSKEMLAVNVLSGMCYQQGDT